MNHQPNPSFTLGATHQAAESSAPTPDIDPDLSTLMEQKEVEEVREPQEEVEDFSGNYSSAGEFSRADIVAALEFTQNWAVAPAKFREQFTEMTGAYHDNQADLLFALYPSSGRMENIEFIRDTAVTMSSPMPPRESMRWGMTFSSIISDMDPERIRSITKMLNTLTPDDFDEIRYRRNMSNAIVAELVLDAISSIDEDANKFLDWAVGIMQIWPGRVQ